MSAMPIPDGSWTVDSEHSEIRFAVKAMWGMSTVRGGFGACTGGLTACDGAASGELAVDARTVDTGNAKRDRHLRSADFFDVERDPWVRFGAATVTAGGPGLTVAGVLRVGTAELGLELPVDVEQAGDGEICLRGTTTVSRAAAGLTWNWLGTIGDAASLQARITLTRESR